MNNSEKKTMEWGTRLGVILAVIALLVVFVAIGERRWRAAGMGISTVKEETTDNEHWRLDLYVVVARPRLGHDDLGILAFARRTVRGAERLKSPCGSFGLS
jgi:hypothetical protein